MMEANWEALPSSRGEPAVARTRLGVLKVVRGGRGILWK